jgi:hypothetical protein
MLCMIQAEVPIEGACCGFGAGISLQQQIYSKLLQLKPQARESSVGMHECFVTYAKFCELTRFTAGVYESLVTHVR